MKRLALILFLTASIPAAPVRGGDGALPLPTGLAPTAPQVPAPVIVDGLPVAPGSEWGRTTFRDRLGKPATEPQPSRLKTWYRETSWRPFGQKSELTEPYDPMRGKTTWCENCAPAVRQPLPPLPAGMSTNRVVPAGAATGEPVGAGHLVAESAAPAKRSCCQKLKDWLCYRQTPMHFPIKPTPRMPPITSYFTPPDYAAAGGYGLGAGGPGNCATGNCATGNYGGAGAMNAGSNRGCTTCPTPGAVIMPGYRLANP